MRGDVDGLTEGHVLEGIAGRREHGGKAEEAQADPADRRRHLSPVQSGQAAQGAGGRIGRRPDRTAAPTLHRK